MNEKFLKVDDVMQILGISKSAAYNIMRQLNNELKEKGYAVIRGKISRKYFEERFYGMTEERCKKADWSGGYGDKGKSVYCVSRCAGDRRTY